MKKAIYVLSLIVSGSLLLSSNTNVQGQVTSKTELYTPTTGYARSSRGVFIQDEKSTQLMLSKHFSGESVFKTGHFTVDEDISMLKISIQGSIRNDGSITITIYTPDDELFKELEIDNSADVQWSQVFTIKEDSDEYTGEWTYEIEADEAEGRYDLSITTH